MGLNQLDEENIDALISTGVLFSRPNPTMVSARIARDWPMNRGFFHNHEQNIYLWVNEEDHLRVISHEEGADLKAAFARYCRLIVELDTIIKNTDDAFMFSNKYGYITSCPSNLGTTMRASVHVQLPFLLHHIDMVDVICRKYNLQIRGTGGAETPITENVFEISNHERLGVGEAELINEVMILSLLQIASKVHCTQSKDRQALKEALKIILSCDPSYLALV